MGLALAAIVKGYKCIFVLADKQSKEKCDMLKAVGAEVVVCPTAVEPEDPRSYYSVSKRLAEETPNGWYVNQYDNPSNTDLRFNIVFAIFPRREYKDADISKPLVPEMRPWGHIYFVHEGIGRYLFRIAIKELLPKKIVWANNKLEPKDVGFIII